MSNVKNQTFKFVTHSGYDRGIIIMETQPDTKTKKDVLFWEDIVWNARTILSEEEIPILAMYNGKLVEYLKDHENTPYMPLRIEFCADVVEILIVNVSCTRRGADRALSSETRRR